MNVPTMWKALAAVAMLAAAGQAGAGPPSHRWDGPRSFADASDAAVVAPLGDVMNPFERRVTEGARRGFTYGPTIAPRLGEPGNDAITTALNGMWNGNGRAWRVSPPPPHVPEAETWAMLGLGLLLLGALARRRWTAGAPRTAST